jgi:hypothetical protein
MAFIRTKKIKGKEYAYIVENSWRKRGKKVKQKTKKYLGRVYRFDRVNIMDFFEYYNIDDTNYYLNNKTKEDIIIDLIKLELYNHGFKDKSNSWQKENITFDLKNRKAYNNKNKSIALAFNEGFLTDHAIKKILNFRAEVQEDGYDLAKLFVEAGIAVPKEIFVGYFRKVFK